MARKKAQPIVTEYQTRSLLDLAELFYSDPANVPDHKRRFPLERRTAYIRWR